MSIYLGTKIEFFSQITKFNAKNQLYLNKITLYRIFSTHFFGYYQDYLYFCSVLLTFINSFTMATGIEQLIQLLKNNPEIAKMLVSSVDIDTVFNLVKSKGVDIAKNELQDYIAKNVNIGDVASTVLKSGAAGDIASTVLKSGAAGSILKGILGGKK